MNACIRAATIEDISAILAIERETASAAHWNTAQYEARTSQGHLLVAERGGTICGFVCANVVAGEWEIENVVVSQAARRQSVASELLAELLKQWRGSAATRVLLEVRDSNFPARRLYEKLGFRQVGRRSGYYQNPAEDAVLYSLDE